MTPIDSLTIPVDRRFKRIDDHKNAVGELMMGKGPILITKRDIYNIIDAFRDLEGLKFTLEITQRSQSIDEPSSQMSIQIEEGEEGERGGAHFELFSVVWRQMDGEGYDEELSVDGTFWPTEQFPELIRLLLAAAES